MEINKALHLIVGLDLSEMDDELIRYLKTLDQLFKIKRVTFLHNIKLGELPGELLAGDQLKRIQKKIREKLIHKVKKEDLPFPFEVEVKMKELSESVFQEYGKKRHFDLLILGNKQKLVGNGALPYKLLRLFPTPVLLVPETFKTPIKTLIKAVTFSRYTKAVLNWAEYFKSSEKEPDIKHYAVHISKVYSYPFVSEKDIKKAVKRDRDKKIKKWKNQYAENYGSLEIVKAGNKNVSHTILAAANQKNADLIILGVKANSIIRDLMVGSVANEIFTRATNISLLFVKPLKK